MRETKKGEGRGGGLSVEFLEFEGCGESGMVSLMNFLHLSIEMEVSYARALKVIRVFLF